MYGVGDCVADDISEEVLEHTPSLLVDQPRKAFHPTATSKTTDGRTRDAFNVVSEDLAMALGPSFAQSFALAEHWDHLVLV